MKQTEQLDKNFNSKNFIDKDDLIYYNPSTSDKMDIYGLLDKENYHRFFEEDLKNIEKENPNVSFLAKDTSGGAILFKTDSSKLVIDATVGPIRLTNSMPLTGITGFDLYIKRDGKWEYLNVTRVEYPNTNFKYVLFDGFSGMHEILINFPLYNSVEQIKIGLCKNAKVEKIQKREKNIVIYGTSLTQGGCASRPGNAYPNILARELNYNVYNFGFTGNGLGEKSVINAICKIKNIDMFIIDYDANAGSTGSLFTTLDEIVKKIRKTYQLIPIVIISRIPYVLEPYNKYILEKMTRRRSFQEEYVLNNAKNDLNLYYINGNHLLGELYNDCYSDDIHLNDLGFRLFFDNIKNKLQEILKEKKMRDFNNVPVYTGKIENEVAPEQFVPCFLGAWYRKCVSSRDSWLGIEGTVKLGEFTLDPKRISLDGKGRVMDNPSCYMGGCADFESDAGVTWSVSFPGSDMNYTLHYTSPKFAFRPFWRNIYQENGEQVNKWCQNDPHQPEYYYLPGDVLKMSVYSPKDDYLQLKIEVIETTTIEKYVKQRERYNLKDNRPSDFISPMFLSPGAGKVDSEYKRVNAIDQYGNEWLNAQMTDATVSEAYWKEVFLYRIIDGKLQKVPFTKDRYTSMICPSPKAIKVYEDGCNVLYGSEKIQIAPKNAKE